MYSQNTKMQTCLPAAGGHFVTLAASVGRSPSLPNTCATEFNTFNQLKSLPVLIGQPPGRSFAWPSGHAFTRKPCGSLAKSHFASARCQVALLKRLAKTLGNYARQLWVQLKKILAALNLLQPVQSFRNARFALGFSAPLQTQHDQLGVVLRQSPDNVPLQDNSRLPGGEEVWVVSVSQLETHLCEVLERIQERAKRRSRVMPISVTPCLRTRSRNLATPGRSCNGIVSETPGDQAVLFCGTRASASFCALKLEPFRLAKLDTLVKPSTVCCFGAISGLRADRLDQKCSGHRRKPCAVKLLDVLVCPAAA